jgi:predicted transcriptional regulator
VTTRNTPRAPLTDLQQAIVEVVWRRGSATSDEVREALKARHPLKDSSMRTLLRRLEARGYLTHDVDGKTFVYRAAQPPQRLAARTIRQMIERFWAGSAEQFLLGMVDERVLDVKEIEALARKVKRAQSRR